jgi:hypothetical protein
MRKSASAADLPLFGGHGTHTMREQKNKEPSHMSTDIGHYLSFPPKFFGCLHSESLRVARPVGRFTPATYVQASTWNCKPGLFRNKVSSDLDADVQPLDEYHALFALGFLPYVLILLNRCDPRTLIPFSSSCGLSSSKTDDAVVPFSPHNYSIACNGKGRCKHKFH